MHLVHPVQKSKSCLSTRMKLIGGFLIVVVLQCISAELNNIDIIAGLGHFLHHPHHLEPPLCTCTAPIQPAAPKIDPTTIAAAYINHKITDYKAIADTLSSLTATDANKALSKLKVIALPLLQSIDANIAYYIYYSPSAVDDASMDITAKYSRFQLALKAVIAAAEKATTLLKGQLIDAVEKDLIELSFAATELAKTLENKILNNAHILAQLNNDYVAYIKLFDSAVHQLVTITKADIQNMFINLVQQRTDGMQLAKAGYSKAFDLLPDRFAHLLKNVLNANDGLEAAVGSLIQLFQTSAGAHMIPTMKMVKTFSLKVFVAVRELGKTISAVNDEAAGNLTPEMVFILPNIQKIFSYPVIGTSYVFNNLSDLLDYLNKTKDTPLYEFSTPLKAESGDIDEMINKLKVFSGMDLSAVYDSTKALLNNAIKQQDSKIVKFKAELN